LKDLTGRSVLITGAASGIGKAAAIAFGREGASPVIVVDINSGGLNATGSELENLGCDVRRFTVDVSDYESIRAMVETVLMSVGRIDILVNVAGWGMMSPIEDLELDDWKGVIDVNLYGTIHMVHAVLPHMIERKTGHIVNVASIDGLFVTMMYAAPYATSKFGVVGFSEALALEASVHGIGVTCLCPGAVRTPSIDSSPIKGFRPEVRKFSKAILLIAEEPEETAQRMVSAVRKNEFLVVTTPFMRASYFLRRHFSFIAYRWLKVWPRFHARVLDKYRLG